MSTTTSASATTNEQHAEFITDQAEIDAWLDEMAQRNLGLSYAEFLRRLDRGEYDREEPEVLQLALLRGLVS